MQTRETRFSCQQAVWGERARLLHIIHEVKLKETKEFLPFVVFTRQTTYDLFICVCLEIGALLSFLSLFNMAQREGSLSAGRAARVSGANRPFFYHFQSVPFRCCCCCFSLNILFLRPSAYVWDFSRNDDSLAWHGKANNKNTWSVMGLNQWTGKK